MKDLRSPLAKAKGLGASGDASHHFWVQRISALAMIGLVIWICFSIVFLPEANYATVVAWLQSPLNGIITLLFVILSFYHAQLGLQVIIEDYISSHSKRLFGILFIKFLSYFMMAAGVYAVIKITLGGH
ncbi:MAG: succinate dehydrogenase / fumarate reductase membrane anchor subunit [Cocleimonas sp.]|jgi:succinate dehydrogenase / fumarate reductase membrane anchor subunit